MGINLTYEELVRRNREEKRIRDAALRKAILIKFIAGAFVSAVCAVIAFSVWNRYATKKRYVNERSEIEARQQEEIVRREAEERRIKQEIAAKRRNEERMEQLRKREEERIAWERKREEERMARELEMAEKLRKQEEERFARERKREEERMARELELAEKRRKQEEERVRLEKERIAFQQQLEEERNEKTKKAAFEARKQMGKAGGIRPPKKNTVGEQYNSNFFKARSQMGGSILEPLVQRLNDINDNEIGEAIPRTARIVVMSKISGQIGPVNYHRVIMSRTITSTENIGSFSGYSSSGGFVTGDVYGPVSRTETRAGNYVCDVPNGFKSSLNEMMSIGRKGHSRANAEVGACIFVDAAKGMIGMDERKALKLFEMAANAGDAEAMFMQSFCLFYGIGNPSNRKKNVEKAYRVLLDWERNPGSQSLRNSGWAKRRLYEAHEFIRD